MKANAFQGNSGSSSYLAGPQSLYLESRRGYGNAHRSSKPELASQKGTAVEKPKVSQPRACFPRQLPPRSCFLSQRNTTHSQAQFHTAIFKYLSLVQYCPMDYGFPKGTTTSEKTKAHQATLLFLYTHTHTGKTSKKHSAPFL